MSRGPVGCTCSSSRRGSLPSPPPPLPLPSPSPPPPLLCEWHLLVWPQRLVYKRPKSQLVVWCDGCNGVSCRTGPRPPASSLHVHPPHAPAWCHLSHGQSAAGPDKSSCVDAEKSIRMYTSRGMSGAGVIVTVNVSLWPGPLGDSTTKQHKV